MEHIQSAIFQTIKEAAKQATTQMLNEIGVDQVIDKIYTFPTEIRRQQDLLLSAKKILEDAKSNLKLAEQVIVAMVVSETDGNGKPRYSNEKAREAEIAQRLANEPDCQRALQTFRDAESKVSSDQFELDRLYNEFSAYKIAAQVLASKLNLVAGL